MKRIFYIMGLALMAFTVSSCSQEDEMASKSSTEEQKENVMSFMSSIDSLQNVYLSRAPYKVVNTDRKKVNWKKWGGKFFSATADACAGALATAASTPVGGFLVGTAASWAYDEFWDRISNKVAKTKRKINSSHGDFPKFVLSEVSDGSSFMDSIGYYHNLILENLLIKGDNYIGLNGDINFDKLLNDIHTVLASHGIQIEAPISFKEEIYSFTESFVKSLNPQDEDSFNKNYPSFRKKAIEELKLAGETFDNIRLMHDKIIGVASILKHEELVEFGKDVQKLIQSSQLQEEQKQEFTVLNEIAVNSQIFWETLEYRK